MNPWVSPKDLKSRLVVDTLDEITEEGVRQSATHFIPEGAVLMVVRSGIRNRPIPVAMAGRPLTVNQDLNSKGIEQHPNALPRLFEIFRPMSRTVELSPTQG